VVAVSRLELMRGFVLVGVVLLRIVRVGFLVR